jgi:hypothetical protein
MPRQPDADNPAEDEYECEDGGAHVWYVAIRLPIDEGT